MKKALLLILFIGLTVFAVENPLERWAKAVGGREKVATIKSIYREATIESVVHPGTKRRDRRRNARKQQPGPPTPAAVRVVPDRGHAEGDRER